MGAAAAPFALAAAGLQAFSSITGGIAQQSAAKQQARAAQDEAAYQADRLRDRRERVLGSQRAGLAASGVDISQGSPLDLLTSTATEAELDIQSTLAGGANRSASAKYQGQVAMRQGLMGAVGSGLQGFGAEENARARTGKASLLSSVGRW